METLVRYILGPILHLIWLWRTREKTPYVNKWSGWYRHGCGKLLNNHDKIVEDSCSRCGELLDFHYQDKFSGRWRRDERGAEEYFESLEKEMKL